MTFDWDWWSRAPVRSSWAAEKVPVIAGHGIRSTTLATSTIVGSEGIRSPRARRFDIRARELHLAETATQGMACVLKNRTDV